MNIVMYIFLEILKVLVSCKTCLTTYNCIFQWRSLVLDRTKGIASPSHGR